MLSAYLGGNAAQIVKPDYPFGFRSILRETVLLEAHAKFMGARMQVESLMLETQFASKLDASKVLNILRKRMARMKWLGQVQLMEIYKREPMLMGAENFVGLYHALEQAGILRDEVQDEEDEPIIEGVGGA